MRLSLSDSLLCLYCFPILSSGVETQKIDFQSDLSNKLDKSYWSKSDVARMAAAAKSSQSSLSLDVVRAQESGPAVLQKPAPDLHRLSSQSVLIPKPTARLVPSTKVKNAVLDSYQKSLVTLCLIPSPPLVKVRHHAFSFNLHLSPNLSPNAR